MLKWEQLIKKFYKNNKRKRISKELTADIKTILLEITFDYILKKDEKND